MIHYTMRSQAVFTIPLKLFRDESNLKKCTVQGCERKYLISFAVCVCRVSVTYVGAG